VPFEKIITEIWGKTQKTIDEKTEKSVRDLHATLPASIKKLIEKNGDSYALDQRKVQPILVFNQ